MVLSILTSLVVVAGVLIAVGCCIILYVRGLVQKIIETAITKQMPLKPYNESVFVLEKTEMGQETEYETMLDRLELTWYEPVLP